MRPEDVPTRGNPTAGGKIFADIFGRSVGVEGLFRFRRRGLEPRRATVAAGWNMAVVSFDRRPDTFLRGNRRRSGAALLTPAAACGEIRSCLFCRTSKSRCE